MKRTVVPILVLISAWQAAAHAVEAEPQLAAPGAVARAGAESALPFTFFMTHYVLLGDPSNPTGVQYESGMPFADAPNGKRIALSGAGGWDPAADLATGGGDYVITNREGAVKQEGTWKAVKFLSFLQLPGWWGIPGFVEEGWQGPPGSPSFSGFLELRVRLDDGRRGILTAWCLMPGVPMPGDHISDGISLEGRGLNFTDYHATEMSFEGMMFYGPGTA
jgi:hypothetical protein